MGSLPVTPFKIVTINIHICTDDSEISMAISRELQSIFFIAIALLSPGFGFGDGTHPRDLIPISAIVLPLQNVLQSEEVVKHFPRLGSQMCYKKRLDASTYPYLCQ